MNKKHALLGLTFSTFLLSSVAVQAQAATCDIDVQPIVAQLISAQTAAASGKQDDALQQLGEAKANLEALEESCLNGPAAVVTPELTNTYTAPDESFSFQYPDGWAADQFTLTLDNFGAGGRAVIASTEAGLKLLTQTIDKTKLEPTDQAAMIIVGSSSTVLYSLGIYDSTVEQPDLSTVEALTDYIQLAIRDGQIFAEVSDPTYEEETAHFSIGNTEFDGLVLLSQLDTDKFAFTLLIGDTGTRPAVNVLAEAIHASIE